MSKPPVVILVEDDDELRQALDRVMVASGFDPRTYGSGEALLAAGTATIAACLVIDLRLPGMNGHDLLHRLRLEGTRAPAIMISAYELSRIKVRPDLDLGVASYLAKPFLGSALIEAIKRAIA